MAKAQVIKVGTEMVVIPADSSERFLVQPAPNIHCMDDYKITLAGISRLTPGYLVERQPSPLHLVLYTRAGTATVKSGGIARKIKQGEVLLVPAGSGFSYYPDSTRWDIFWFHLANTPDWNQLFPLELSVHKSQWGQEVRVLMESYIRETDARRSDSQRPLKLLIEMMVLYLKRELGIEPPEFTEARQILQKLWETVHADLPRKWSVDQMARQANLSKSKLYRMCLKVHDMTPMAMIKTMRMEQAAEMLASTTYPLTTIADGIGYEDAFTFSKAFKRYSGISPKEYRKECRSCF